MLSYDVVVVLLVLLLLLLLLLTIRSGVEVGISANVYTIKGGSQNKIRFISFVIVIVIIIIGPVAVVND
jgi:hypothetical protein